MATKLAVIVLTLALAGAGAAHAQTASGDTVPVTADNFTRAETDTYFANIVKSAGGVGKFFHRREIEPIENQIVIRGNRDTIYSAAVFDLDAGPVTVTLPDAGSRFMSMIVIDEDQYTPAVYYGAGSHTFTGEQIGTRYLMLALRTFVDPNDPADIEKVHALQDAVEVEQPGGPGTFEIPNWDPVSHKKVRDALLVLYATLPDQNRMFGTKEQVDPVRRLIGSAGGWGGNPDSEAKYLNVNPSRNDGNDRVQAHGRERCPGRWLLVDHRLRRRGPSSEERVRCVFGQQHHGTEKRRWFGRCPVRRLRRQDPQLPADHARLELHGAPLSPARRNPGRHMDLPGGRARDLSSPRTWTPPT